MFSIQSHCKIEKLNIDHIAMSQSHIIKSSSTSIYSKCPFIAVLQGLALKQSMLIKSLASVSISCITHKSGIPRLKAFWVDHPALRWFLAREFEFWKSEVLLLKARLWNIFSSLSKSVSHFRAFAFVYKPASCVAFGEPVGVVQWFPLKCNLNWGDAFLTLLINVQVLQVGELA